MSSVLDAPVAGDRHGPDRSWSQGVQGRGVQEQPRSAERMDGGSPSASGRQLQHLRRDRVFPDVPVRIDHTSSMRDRRRLLPRVALRRSVPPGGHPVHQASPPSTSTTLVTFETSRSKSGNTRQTTKCCTMMSSRDLRSWTFPPWKDSTSELQEIDDMAVKDETKPVTTPSLSSRIPRRLRSRTRARSSRSRSRTRRGRRSSASGRADLPDQRRRDGRPRRGAGAHRRAGEVPQRHARPRSVTPSWTIWSTQGKILGPQVEQFKAHAASLSDHAVRSVPDDVRRDARPQPARQARHDDRSDRRRAQDTADELAIAKEVIAAVQACEPLAGVHREDPAVGSRPGRPRQRHPLRSVRHALRQGRHGSHARSARTTTSARRRTSSTRATRSGTVASRPRRSTATSRRSFSPER